MSKRRLEQELERAILQGLAQEWESARAGLPPRVAAALRPPTFKLSDMRSRWGCWDGTRRQIAISRRLALKYPWDSVREILLHEMAHQVAQQSLGGGSGKPHGPEFQQACSLLQANPAATGNYPLLEERIRSGEVRERDRMMIRIDKLMALAQSSHRHEAEAAMLKAHQLISRYHLKRIKTGPERFFISAFAGSPALRHQQDAYHLANLLQDCYFVRGIWVTAFVIEKQKMGRVLEISGTPKNVDIARHVHAVMERTIGSEWRRYKSARRTPRGSRVDFATGVISGFKQKIERQMAASFEGARSKALIRLKDPALGRYFEKRYPRTRSISRGGRRRHAGVEADGNKIGRRLVIAKAVEQRADEGGRRMLTE